MTAFILLVFIVGLLSDILSHAQSDTWSQIKVGDSDNINDGITDKYSDCRRAVSILGFRISGMPSQPFFAGLAKLNREG